MPRKVNLDKLPPFPKRIPEKLKAIREHLQLTADAMAPKVGAKTGAEILAYENDEDDLLISVLWGYTRLAGIPVENLIYDDRDLWLGQRQNKRLAGEMGTLSENARRRGRQGNL